MKHESVLILQENMDHENRTTLIHEGSFKERTFSYDPGAASTVEIDMEERKIKEERTSDEGLLDSPGEHSKITTKNIDIIKQEVFIKQESPTDEDGEAGGENWATVEQQPLIVEPTVVNETTVEERLFLAGHFKVEYPAHDFEHCSSAHAKAVSANDVPVSTIRVEKVKVDRLCETQKNGNDEGKRSTAVAVTFICFASVHDPSSWKQSDIDNCLTAGNLLNDATLKKLEKGNTYLLTLPDQREILFGVQANDKIHGTLDQSCSEPSFPSCEISEGLCKLFSRDYNAGILTTNNSSMGIFRRGDFIWLFDSHFDGKSVLIQFTDVKYLANHVWELYNGNDSFVITPISGIKLLKEESYNNSFTTFDGFSMREGSPNRSNNKKQNRERFSKKKRKREQLQKARLAKRTCSTITNTNTKGNLKSNKETVNNGSILGGNNLKQLSKSHEADSCLRSGLQRKTPISGIFELRKEDRHNNSFITFDSFSMREGSPSRSNNKKQKRERFSKKKQKREQLKKARLVRLAKRASSTVTNSNTEEDLESNKKTMKNGSILDGNNLKQLSESHKADSCLRSGLQRKCRPTVINVDTYYTDKFYRRKKKQRWRKHKQTDQMQPEEQNVPVPENARKIEMP